MLFPAGIDSKRLTDGHPHKWLKTEGDMRKCGKYRGYGVSWGLAPVGCYLEFRVSRFRAEWAWFAPGNGPLSGAPGADQAATNAVAGAASAEHLVGVGTKGRGPSEHSHPALLPAHLLSIASAANAGHRIGPFGY